MDIDVVLIVLGALVLGPGLLSTALKRVWLSLPLVALVAGVLLGPELVGVIEPEQLGDERRILEEVARVTLAVSLTATGLQFTRDDLRVNASRGALLLTVVMVGMWGATSLGAWALLDVPVWFALLVGAILTPTDPVVASTLVTGSLAEKNVPRPIRRSLQLESGGNDGLALVFVLLPAIVLSEPSGEFRLFAGEAAKQLGIALAVGLAFGWVAAWLVNTLVPREGLEQSSLFACALALAVLTLGAAHWLGGTGVLASFLAGVVFSVKLGEQYARELESVQSGVERFLLVPVFALFGALLPWDEWATLGGAGLAFAAWVLLLRRPPIVPPALSGTDTPRRGVAFLAWYGPLGVAAIYYSTFVERYGFAEYETVFAAAALAVTASVAVHSISATPGVRGYAGRSPFTPLRHPLSTESDDA